LTESITYLHGKKPTHIKSTKEHTSKYFILVSIYRIDGHVLFQAHKEIL
jgi:hypothetical protein